MSIFAHSSRAQPLCVILHGDGVLHALESVAHPHLDLVARRGMSGELVLRTSTNPASRPAPQFPTDASARVLQGRGGDNQRQAEEAQPQETGAPLEKRQKCVQDEGEDEERPQRSVCDCEHKVEHGGGARCESCPASHAKAEQNQKTEDTGELERKTDPVEPQSFHFTTKVHVEVPAQAGETDSKLGCNAVLMMNGSDGSEENARSRAVQREAAAHKPASPIETAEGNARGIVERESVKEATEVCLRSMWGSFTIPHCMKHKAGTEANCMQRLNGLHAAFLSTSERCLSLAKRAGFTLAKHLQSSNLPEDTASTVVAAMEEALREFPQLRVIHVHCSAISRSPLAASHDVQVLDAVAGRLTAGASPDFPLLVVAVASGIGAGADEGFPTNSFLSDPAALVDTQKGEKAQEVDKAKEQSETRVENEVQKVDGDAEARDGALEEDHELCEPHREDGHDESAGAEKNGRPGALAASGGISRRWIPSARRSCCPWTDLALRCGLRPRQSVESLDVFAVEEDSWFSPLVVSYYGENQVRCDPCQSFNCAAIVDKGGCGKMLADYFMHEIAFKVGVLPKFGS